MISNSPPVMLNAGKCSTTVGTDYFKNPVLCRNHSPPMKENMIGLWLRLIVINVLRGQGSSEYAFKFTKEPNAKLMS